MIDKNMQRLKHIIEYCEQINHNIENLDDTGRDFQEGANYRIRDLCSFYLLQIGELTRDLTDSFKEEYPDIPWRSIRGFRNIVAHKYGTVDTYMLWDIVKNDIPILNQKCTEIIHTVNLDLEVEIEKDLAEKYGIMKRSV